MFQTCTSFNGKMYNVFLQGHGDDEKLQVH